MATIHGTKHRDVLHGTTEADTIRGGRGADVIYGDDGTDFLWGGKGRDVFVFNGTDNDLDRIMDFQIGKDTIVVAMEGGEEFHMAGDTIWSVTRTYATPDIVLLNEARPIARLDGFVPHTSFGDSLLVL